jgi:tRNA(Phe) wybutosine-synthesizing methylase Tyw3
MRPHVTTPIRVRVDVDTGIVALVRRLNRMRGVRTHASCQGTKTMRPYVMVSWRNERVLTRLRSRFDILMPAHSNGTWGYVHPVNKDTLRP